jgi:outer membrane protein OmpA-like peptidoglycan-associated protein
MTMILRSTIARVAAALSLGAATACTIPHQEAGAQIDEGRFGNPTMHNTLAQTRGHGAVLQDLNRRFSAEIDPTVTFAFNSATLDSAAQATLRRQANWIRQFPEVRFKVFGHTDLVGSDSYNRSLGLRRAQAVVNYLISQGVSRSRLEAVVSFGEEQPIIVTQGRERRNRRTVTEVTGFVKSHPMLLDGKYAQVVYREYVRSAVPPSGLSGAYSGDGGGLGGGAGG